MHGVGRHGVHPHSIILRAPCQPTGSPEPRSGIDPNTSVPQDLYMEDLEDRRMPGILLLACSTIMDVHWARRQHRCREPSRSLFFIEYGSKGFDSYWSHTTLPVETSASGLLLGKYIPWFIHYKACTEAWIDLSLCKYASCRRHAAA